jgi:hypothetical protein
MTTTIDRDAEFAAKLAAINTASDAMDTATATRLWAEFTAYCDGRTRDHDRSARYAAAPLTPDVVSQGDWYAAGIRLGHLSPV